MEAQRDFEEDELLFEEDSIATALCNDALFAGCCFCGHLLGSIESVVACVSKECATWVDGHSVSELNTFWKDISKDGEGIYCKDCIKFKMEPDALSNLNEARNILNHAEEGVGENYILAAKILRRLVIEGTPMTPSSILETTGIFVNISQVVLDDKIDMEVVRSFVGQEVDATLMAGLMSGVEHVGWLLDDRSVMAPLAHLLEEVNEASLELDPVDAHALIGAALLSVGPAVKFLASRDSDDIDLSLLRAQKSVPLCFPDFLSVEEIDQLMQFAKSERQSDSSKGGKGWVTKYLQINDSFRDNFPIITDRIFKLVRQHDHLKLLPDILNLRCVEMHTVTKGGSLPDPTHYDKGSLYTIDVLLSSDFDGGDFVTLEKDGGFSKPKFDSPGTAVLFVSHKYHCVRPVIGGERNVLVIEIWSGDNRVCGHRCETRHGVCDAMNKKLKVYEGSPSSVVLGDCLETAHEVLASTAFHGRALFKRVAALQQIEMPENVEVRFEGSSPVARVYAIRAIEKGEKLSL